MATSRIEETAMLGLRMLEELRKLDPEMTAQEAQCLLGVAAWPGISVRELAERVGVEPPTASRNIAILGRYGRGGKEGLKLIDSQEDPEDRRHKRLSLTAHGKKVLGAMADRV